MTLDEAKQHFWAVVECCLTEFHEKTENWAKAVKFSGTKPDQSRNRADPHPIRLGPL